MSAARIVVGAVVSMLLGASVGVAVALAWAVL
jgi:hypothetical protein